MWPFYLRRAVLSSRQLDVPSDKVTSAVQDPVFLIELNPLVIGYTTDPDDPTRYTITDRLTILGCVNTQMSYTCKFTTVEGGADTDTHAGLGTDLSAQWRVRGVEGAEGKSEITEHVTVEALFFMMPYVLSTLRTSHQTLLDNLVKKLENRDTPKGASSEPPPEQ